MEDSQTSPSEPLHGDESQSPASSQPSHVMTLEAQEPAPVAAAAGPGEGGADAGQPAAPAATAEVPPAAAPAHAEPQTAEPATAAAPAQPAAAVPATATHDANGATPATPAHPANGANDADDAKTAAETAAQEAADKKDFAAILAEFEQEHGGAERQANAGGAAPAGHGRNAAGGGVPGVPNIGQKVSGKVVSIGEEKILVDLGAKSEGVIDAAQLRDAEGKLTVNVGDTVDATVASVDAESGVIVLRKRAGGGRGGHQEVATELRQAFQYGMPVEGMVTGINKGGAEIQVYGMRAFCPLSQLDLRYVENPQQFIGQRLKFKVARIEEGSRNRRPDIVLSRRALLEEEAQSKAAELRSRLQVGAVLKGRVTSLTAYGAFIDLGGLEGLLHVSEIGYSRLADPREALTVGQEVEVQVIKIEKGKDEKRPERISLSRRALERDPWRDAASRFPEGTVMTGRVMRMESFGAFVALAPGLEGLVHVSEMGGGRRVNHAREVVQTGQDVQVRVLNVDPVKRRISLSMALADDPGAADEPAPRERERGERGERGERESPGASQPQQQASFGSLGDFFKSSNQRRK
jgi:small subunit ribosomal protein S1